MTPLTTPHTSHLNHLRRGSTYLARTRAGAFTGEYLGLEAPHGDHAILLRRAGSIASIPVQTITSVALAAA